MINGWTKSEICMLYREAKDKKQQITILTELTGMRRFEVESILEEGGYINQMTDLVKERIKQLYNEGLSDKAIGRELSVSQSQVSTFLRKQGLPPNGIKIQKKNEIQEDKEVEKMVDYRDGHVEQFESVKTVQPEVKQEIEQIEAIEKLKKETQKNVDELKEILPKSIPAGTIKPEDVPFDYDVVETLTPQQYYEMAKMTIQSINSMIELMRTVWEG